MQPDLEDLFYRMALIRRFEEATASLWHRGLISGELHLGTGEEAIATGVVSHLRDGDGLAVDHRSTPPFVARGADLETILLELLGSERGLCGGWGGHMHLFDPDLLTASSGIVGSSGPLACGFALSAQNLRPGNVAVAFFGEGAMNQGMLLESLNLASAWKLPVVFVCKNNQWAITTRCSTVTGGNLIKRARGFGMPATRVNGLSVDSVWKAAGRAVTRARNGRGPSFIAAGCPRMTGHFLGDPLIRVFQEPVKQMTEISGPLVRAAVTKPGAGIVSRMAGLRSISLALAKTAAERFLLRNDPLSTAHRLLPEDVCRRIEVRVKSEVEEAVTSALAGLEGDTNG